MNIALASPLLKEAMNTKRELKGSERRAEEALCESIMVHLKRHPHAEDALEGIAQWWLPGQQIPTETARVKIALLRLVRRKRLIARHRLDGRVFYRLNSERRQKRERVK